MIAAHGLRPASLYHVDLADERADRPIADRLMTDARGEIPPTVIWPLIGINGADNPRPRTLAEIRRGWHARRIRVRGRLGKWSQDLRAEITAASERPLVLASDEAGRILPGIEAGKVDPHVVVTGASFSDEAMVFLVPRQHGWFPGDRIRPVTLASGRPAIASGKMKPGGRESLFRIARAAEVPPGAYDFIVRRVRYGYEDDEDMILRPDDLVGGQGVTGLVVRREFWTSKVIRGGCVNLLEIAGRSVIGAPYMQFTDVFQVGEDIYGALDPTALDPTHVGKGVALYVVPHKTTAQWSADPSLQHLPVIGGNPAVQKFQTQSYCINANKRLLWPNATQVGEYDIVADFGNNSPNFATFLPDATYNMPLDMIDGYIQPGFRIVNDPTTETSYPASGHFVYDQTTQGTVTVSGDEVYGTTTVPRKASVYFPADAPGATTVGQISAAQASYPLVLIIHGNGADTGYLGYEYLMDHFARNGFIAASVYQPINMGGTGRARILNSHLNLLRSLFGAKAQNNIGIMGHSRGGEGVCIAARLNQQENWGHQIRAVIALAPTDQYTFESLGGMWATPFLCIYGSMDGDLGYVDDTGFRLYDRARDAEKSMVFVYGAIHDRFNTVWGDGDLYFGELGGTDLPKIINADAHQKIAKGYMSAFFRMWLRNESQWAGIFRGEWVPAAAAQADAKAKFYVQYEHSSPRRVDDFEGVHSSSSWQSSTIGAAVDDSSSLPVDPVENQLFSIDPHSPHDTGGLLLRWDSTADLLRFDVPVGQRNVATFSAVSFRITQKVNSAANPPNLPQDLRLTLHDENGNSRAIMVSRFAEIPPPDKRYYDQYTKSAMRTVRIQLGAFRIHCVGVTEVDLTKVDAVTLEFTEKVSGEVEIDSVQFSL